MINILSLPASIRIFVFSMLILSSSLVLLTTILNIFIKRKDINSYYYVSVLATLLTMLITRTPLLYGLDITVSEYLNLIVILPAILSIICFIKHKKIIYIFDCIYFALNITYLCNYQHYNYVVSALSIYALARSILAFITVIDLIKLDKGVFIIKEALDSLHDGIIYYNSFGRIIYINNYMNDVLNLLGISSYNNIKHIISCIKNNSEKLNDEVFIYNYQSKYFKFNFKNNQITVSDITTLESLIIEERNIGNLLNEKNKELNSNLDMIISKQNEIELINLKSHIHDNLAQQLSILHMFMLKDDKKEIGEIKNLLSDIDITPSDKIYPIETLINSFMLIGVEININGTMPENIEHYSLFYDAIKECTTNAIKHGFAKNVFVEIIDNSIMIKNNGNIDPNFKLGNGLSSLKFKTESLGGNFSIDATNDFKVSINL